MATVPHRMITGAVQSAAGGTNLQPGLPEDCRMPTTRPLPAAEAVLALSTKPELAAQYRANASSETWGKLVHALWARLKAGHVRATGHRQRVTHGTPLVAEPDRVEISRAEWLHLRLSHDAEIARPKGAFVWGLPHPLGRDRLENYFQYTYLSFSETEEGTASRSPSRETANARQCNEKRLKQWLRKLVDRGERPTSKPEARKNAEMELGFEIGTRMWERTWAAEAPPEWKLPGRRTRNLHP